MQKEETQGAWSQRDPTPPRITKFARLSSRTLPLLLLTAASQYHRRMSLSTAPEVTKIRINRLGHMGEHTLLPARRRLLHR